MDSLEKRHRFQVSHLHTSVEIPIEFRNTALDLRNKTLCASGFHAPERGKIDILDDVLIDVSAGGTISAIHRPSDPNYRSIRDAREATGELVTLPSGSYLLPGFIDLHVHAPQYPQLGSALDVPLEVWLQKYTFPLEARYEDLAFARRSYGLLVNDLLANGTTTALYFATIHQDATRTLVDTCIEKGQRALIGKVSMDNVDECPDYYLDASPEAAIEGTRALIDYVRAHPENTDGRVLPVITPRFIPSCTDATLEGLGALAKECGCHVQTHCSESDWAHGYVLSRYGVTDTEALDRFGLLGRRTVLAHANFLTTDDMDRVREREAAVAHCPLSNVYFANAVFPLRAALDKGVHVGLGTDYIRRPERVDAGELPRRHPDVARFGERRRSQARFSGTCNVRSRSDRFSRCILYRHSRRRCGAGSSRWPVPARLFVRRHCHRYKGRERLRSAVRRVR